jgi:hypothetical protein
MQEQRGYFLVELKVALKILDVTVNGIRDEGWILYTEAAISKGSKDVLLRHWSSQKGYSSRPSEIDYSAQQKCFPYINPKSDGGGHLTLEKFKTLSLYHVRWGHETPAIQWTKKETAARYFQVFPGHCSVLLLSDCEIQWVALTNEGRRFVG